MTRFDFICTVMLALGSVFVAAQFLKTIAYYASEGFETPYRPVFKDQPATSPRDGLTTGASSPQHGRSHAPLASVTYLEVNP